MKRALAWIALTLLTLAGAIGVVGYVAGAFYVTDRSQYVTDYGAIAAFAAAGLVAGGLSLLALAMRLTATVRFPNEWLALALFGLMLCAGFASVIFDRYLLFTPLLAIIAAAALFAFIARLSMRWSPGKRIAARGFVLPGVWGMVGAPLTAVVAQVVTAVMLVSGGVAGLYLADASLMDSIGEWITEATELTDLSIIRMPTIAAGTLAMLGIVAPLTEEFAKFLGVYLVLRRRVTTRLGVFLAGASAGLGFAVVETLGYALMAVDQWPQVMLIRAPVAFIHVAATTIVALGWYKQRQSGGYWLVGFFALSVLLHGAWNSLFVSMLIVAGDVTSADVIDPATAFTALVLVSAMGAVLVGAVMWIVGNARRLGREAVSAGDVPGTTSVVSCTTAGASSY
ncbi:hypothetical protein BH24CHL1_BH24CHL1_04720 [soil metagenome]